MRTKIIVVLIVILLGCVFALWDMLGTPKVTRISNTQITEMNVTPAPFEFKTMEGEIVTSESLKGKVIILNFWASWCVPCAIEFPDLITLTSKFPKDTVFLALSVDEDHDNARRFVSRFKDTPQPNRIIGFDPDKKISQDIFQTTKYPETYILDRNFVIRRHIVGVIDWDDKGLRADIQSLIAEAAKNK